MAAAPLHHGAQRSAPYRAQRSLSNSARYDHKWRKASTAYRQANPFCVECLAAGILNDQYIEVDHIVPLCDAPERKYDPDNLRSLCKSHHTQRHARDHNFLGHEKKD